MTEQSTPALADSSSPFLRHGAEQPVEWLPWGEHAFERARSEERPILLDVGAVWCHWCHVMDHESYDREEMAELINEQFIPIKVDRDARPDVDARMQRAVRALSGQGGWPLTAFLTPDGEPFYGGTYFPPDDRQGRPAFTRVLNEIARVWDEERERARESAGAVRERLGSLGTAGGGAGELSRTVVERAADEFAGTFDARHGGFGRAPKFPNAGALELLLDRYLDTGEEEARRAVAGTLDAMARGGIYDQLGGGFHRYSTDARWLVPHFEKMAYDNGVLLGVYARAAAALDEPLWGEVCEGVVAYYEDVAPELVGEGGFPASQDADVGPDDDGDYWTWTVEEIREALAGDEEHVRAAVLRYGLEDPESAMRTDPSRHVLYRARTVDEVAEELEIDEGEAAGVLDDIDRRLKNARDERERPFVDTSQYSNWVGLVASGHLAAARYLGIERAEDHALRALDRVWREAFEPEEGLAHRLGEPGAGRYLEDQAYVARALLDAFELTQREEYLERARRLADVLLDRFRDPEHGGFRDRPRAAEGSLGVLEAPHRPITDSPTPSGNAVAALALLRLGALTGTERYREAAVELLGAFADQIGGRPTAAATWVRAVDRATAPASTVAIVGDDDTADALFRTALASPRPRTVVRRIDPGDVATQRAASLPSAMQAMVTADAPRAYLCAGETCAAPVHEPDALRDLLRTFNTGAPS